MGALANRVFVSARSGNDANTCDNILAPCQTFAGAVTKLNPGGEAIVLDSGGYGAVTITKSLTIEAPAGVTAFVHPSSGDAITISAGASDTVVLRGLVLNVGTANGILVNSVGTLSVENCAISGFTVNGIRMLGAGKLNVKHTDIKGCFIGIQIDNTAGTVIAAIDHCHLDGNDAGFRAASVAPGQSRTAASNSTSNNNLEFGWLTEQTSGPNVVDLEFCTGSGNGSAGLQNTSNSASSVTSYSNCVFSNNGSHGVEQAVNGVVQSRGNNTLTGNVSGPTDGVIGTFPAM